MGLELKIFKELGSLNATAIEWQGFSHIVNATLPETPFKQRLNTMLHTLPGCYGVVVFGLSPLFTIATFEQFQQNFDIVQRNYQDSFLKLASRPRHYAENTHELYLELAGAKEMKTGYPLLKRTFGNLYEFMDKWVTNDAWLVMSCDVIFKSTNRLLLDIAEFHKQDIDEAWLIFESATRGMKQLTEHLPKDTRNR